MVLKATTIFIIAICLCAAVFAFNTLDWIIRFFSGVKPGVTLDGIEMSRLLEDEVSENVLKIAEIINHQPINARYDKMTDTIESEIPGLQVDVRATVEAVMNAESKTDVNIVLTILEPEITEEIFRSINNKIAVFSTSGGGGGGRTDNLYISAKYMNGTILAPGDVFSFNNVTGPRTLARGYSMAPIVGGMGIGGGVCQVSTTIYNTALIAKMEIIERYPHSIRVYYVPEGKDASVTNYADFKFRNSTDKYIQIRSGAGGGHVWVQIWSQ